MCEGTVYCLRQTIQTTDDCFLLPFRLLLFYLPFCLLLRLPFRLLLFYPPFCLLLRLLVRSLLCYRGLLVLRKLVGARLLLQIQCHTGLVELPDDPQRHY